MLGRPFVRTFANIDHLMNKWGAYEATFKFLRNKVHVNFDMLRSIMLHKIVSNSDGRKGHK